MSMKPPYSSMAEPTITALCPFLLVGIWVYTHGQTHKHTHAHTNIYKSWQGIYLPAT